MDNEKDLDIELGKPVRRHIEHKNSPLRDPKLATVPYDDPGSGQIPVFVAESVMRSIEEVVLRDRDREVGGVLLGGFYRNEEGSFVEVTDFIEAKGAPGTDISVTFTHDAWEQINAEQSARGPDAQIVGWYHSHPGLGVFMSSEDTFVHSSFFADPWHVAIVVDPLYHNWGCFKWRDGSLERTGGFYIFTQKRDARRLRTYAKKLAATKTEAPPSARAGAQVDGYLAVSRLLLPTWAALAVLVLALVVVGYVAFGNRLAPDKEPDYYQRAIELLNACDLSGGESLLRRELTANPTNEKAYKDLIRLGAIISEADSAGLLDENLDRINFSLRTADRGGKVPIDYGTQREIEDLKDADGNQLKQKTWAENGLVIYKQAEPTRNERIERAKSIRQIASRQNPKPTNQWWHKAVDWLEDEWLREIAYGMAASDGDYVPRYRELSKKQQKQVDGYQAKLFPTK